jgi:hypothetical protein
MKKFHELISKKQWFILFNVAALVMLVLQGRLTSGPESLAASVIGLLLINGVAAISARNFPDWK